MTKSNFNLIHGGGGGGGGGGAIVVVVVVVVVALKFLSLSSRTTFK